MMTLNSLSGGLASTCKADLACAIGPDRPKRKYRLKHADEGVSKKRKNFNTNRDLGDPEAQLELLKSLAKDLCFNFRLKFEGYSGNVTIPTYIDLLKNTKLKDCGPIKASHHAYIIGLRALGLLGNLLQRQVQSFLALNNHLFILKNVNIRLYTSKCTELLPKIPGPYYKKLHLPFGYAEKKYEKKIQDVKQIFENLNLILFDPLHSHFKSFLILNREKLSELATGVGQNLFLEDGPYEVEVFSSQLPHSFQKGLNSLLQKESTDSLPTDHAKKMTKSLSVKRHYKGTAAAAKIVSSSELASIPGSCSAFKPKDKTKKGLFVDANPDRVEALLDRTFSLELQTWGVGELETLLNG